MSCTNFSDSWHVCSLIVYTDSAKKIFLLAFSAMTLECCQHLAVKFQPLQLKKESVAVSLIKALLHQALSCMLTQVAKLMYM